LAVKKNGVDMMVLLASDAGSPSEVDDGNAHLSF
jgi:hypothetical protein